VKLVHLVGFITNKYVTMHGHTNVKNGTESSSSITIFDQLTDCLASAEGLCSIITSSSVHFVLCSTLNKESDCEILSKGWDDEV
jgi:hypothetical protein